MLFDKAFYEKNISCSRFIIVHLCLHSLSAIGLSSAAASIVQHIVPYWILMSGSYDLYVNINWTKLPALLNYVFATTALIGIFLIGVYITRNSSRINEKYGKIKLKKAIVYESIPVLIFLLFLSCISENYKFNYSSVLLSLIWCISLLSLFFSLAISNVPIGLQKKSVLAKKEVFFYLSFNLFIMLIVFVPLIIFPLHIKNDYFDIPETTILKGNTRVDNHRFINERRLEGLLKYDPRTNRGITPEKDKCLSAEIGFNENLNAFLESQKFSGTSFFYDYDTKKLMVHSEISPEEFKILESLSKNEKEKIRITKLYMEAKNLNKVEKIKKYSKTEIDFINKNVSELSEQFKLGRLFYHHNFIFGPILAISNGLKPTEVPILYGEGLTYTLARILKSIKQINYQWYFKLLFSSYPLYFLILLNIVYLIFKQVHYPLIVGAVWLASTMLIGPSDIIMAPGFAPLRHLIDLPFFYMVYRYWGNKKVGYMIAAMAIGAFAVWWNKEFGLFLILAAVSSELAKCIIFKDCVLKKSLAFVIGLLLLLLLFFALKSYNPLIKYMLIGVGSPPTSLKVILSVICSTIIGLIALWYLSDHESWTIQKENLWMFGLIILIYTTEVSIYPLWYPNADHFLSVVIPDYILFMAVVAKLFFMVKPKIAEKQFFYLNTSVRLVIFLLLLPTTIWYQFNLYQHNKIFNDHEAYKWNFKNAKIITTMAPEPFENAISTIEKYSSNPGIHMISKYDNIIPGLTGKYLKFPFNQIADIFTTKKESEKAAESIIRDSPEYIFVDTDIRRGYLGDIPYPFSYLGEIKFGPNENNYKLAVGRAYTLNRMKDIFQRIKPYYKKVEEGELISVYKKI